MIEIGNRIETPEGVFYELEYGGEGNIYKNEDAFSTAPMKCAMYLNTRQKTVRTGVCRRAVTAVSRITHCSPLCKGNEEVCQDLFLQP